jgi:hypothetical protein
LKIENISNDEKSSIQNSEKKEEISKEDSEILRKR